MTLQAKIASRASKLSRRIYASLPLEYRVARLLVQLKVASIEETYGRALYAEFIKAGVTDMPPVGKMPAEELREQLIRKGNKAANLLPIGYGGRFGREMWTIAMKGLGAYKSEDNAMEVMQGVVADIYGGTQQAIKGLPRSSAESYIKKRVAWRATDFLRKQIDKPQSLTDLGTQTQIDLIDEGALKRLVHMIGDSGKRYLQTHLREVDPRHPEWAWEWIVAQLDGKAGKELAEDWGVAPSMVTQWVSRHMEDIRDIFREVMEAAA